MKLEDMKRANELVRRFGELEATIKQDVPYETLNLDVCMNVIGKRQLYFALIDCPPEVARAIADIIVSEYQKKRDAIVEELKALGVEV